MSEPNNTQKMLRIVFAMENIMEQITPDNYQGQLMLLETYITALRDILRLQIEKELNNAGEMGGR